MPLVDGTFQLFITYDSIMTGWLNTVKQEEKKYVGP